MNLFLKKSGPLVFFKKKPRVFATLPMPDGLQYDVLEESSLLWLARADVQEFEKWLDACDHGNLLSCSFCYASFAMSDRYVILLVYPVNLCATGLYCLL